MFEQFVCKNFTITGFPSSYSLLQAATLNMGITGIKTTSCAQQFARSNDLLYWVALPQHNLTRTRSALLQQARCRATFSQSIHLSTSHSTRLLIRIMPLSTQHCIPSRSARQAPSPSPTEIPPAACSLTPTNLFGCIPAGNQSHSTTTIAVDAQESSTSSRPMPVRYIFFNRAALGIRNVPGPSPSH